MSEEIDDVKKVLRSLLVTVPNGMCVTELQREFRQMEGRNIPCGRFNSIIEFLDSIPETVRLSVYAGKQYVHPVISKDNNHIMKFVREQNLQSKRKPRRFPPKPKYHSHSAGRPTVHQYSNHIRPQAAYQSNHSTETSMSSRHEPHNDAWHSPRENANLFVTELIEADFNFGKSSPTANNVQLPSLTANATFEANNPKQNTNILARISPSEEYAPKIENSPELACAVRAVADYRCNDEQTDEENDALPKMTRFEFMTLLDDDEYIITSKDPFANLSLSQYEMGGVGSTMKIIVSEVHSPYKFWFQLQHSMAELEQLMDALKFYDDNISNKDLHLPEHLIRPGQICVAMYEKQWHRARIVDVYEDEAIKVFYLDYGTVDEVFVDDIRLMRRDCVELLPQAFRGCLDNIRPSDGLWTRQATKTFKNVVQNINVYANVTAIDTDEKTYYVNITDTTKEVDVKINDVLIDNGYALDEKERMVQMKCRPYNERYPTFDNLENGEYPSFAEIGHFQSQGYDFAIYEQSIIIPEMCGYSTNI